MRRFGLLLALAIAAIIISIAFFADEIKAENSSEQAMECESGNATGAATDYLEEYREITYHALETVSPTAENLQIKQTSSTAESDSIWSLNDSIAQDKADNNHSSPEIYKQEKNERTSQNVSDIAQFREMLEIDNQMAVRVSVAEKFSQLRNADKDVFEDIVNIAQEAAGPEGRQQMVYELLEMDRQFVREFSSIATKDSQIKAYLKFVKNPKAITVELDDQAIRDALTGKKDFDQIISEIW